MSLEKYFTRDRMGKLTRETVDTKINKFLEAFETPEERQEIADALARKQLTLPNLGLDHKEQGMLFMLWLSGHSELGDVYNRARSHTNAVKDRSNQPVIVIPQIDNGFEYEDLEAEGYLTVIFGTINPDGQTYYSFGADKRPGRTFNVAQQQLALDSARAFSIDSDGTRVIQEFAEGYREPVMRVTAPTGVEADDYFRGKAVETSTFIVGLADCQQFLIDLNQVGLKADLTVAA